MKESLILPAEPKLLFLQNKDAILAAFRRVLESGTYILGPELAVFEREFGAYLNAQNVIGVANGTDALEIAIRALEPVTGDIVVTVGNTVTATVSAIRSAECVPEFVDITADTMLMCPESLAQALTRLNGRVKAIIPVHLYGHPADMREITRVAQEHGVPVIEDCAQSHGASIDGRATGTWGDLAAFSFYPTKNLGALGDAGAVVANDAAIAERVRLLRQYGWKTRYVSEIAGRNSRLDEIQAAILSVRLKCLSDENQRRASLATQYRNKLSTLEIVTQGLAPNVVHSWHQLVIRIKRRNDLQKFLSENGVIASILYPVPVYRQPGYLQNIKLPNTERACAEVLSLPLHPALNETDVTRVLGLVEQWRLLN